MKFGDDLGEMTYSTKSGRKPRLLLTLGNIQVIDDQNLVCHPGNFVFVLQKPTRKLYLSATTEQERRRWVAELRSMLQEAYFGLNRPSIDSDIARRSLISASKPTLSRWKRRLDCVSKKRRVERKRQQLTKMKQTYAEIWQNVVSTLLSGRMRDDVSMLESLCFAGIPKEFRGRVWAWLLGNKLQVSEDLFEICKSRAQAVQMEMSLKRHVDHSVIESLALSSGSFRGICELRTRSVSSASSASSISEPNVEDDQSLVAAQCMALPLIAKNTIVETLSTGQLKAWSLDAFDTNNLRRARRSSAVLPTQNILQDAVSIAEMLVAHGERSIKLVNIDMPRTFGHHPLFQPGAEGTERTTEVLEAYICYRPDLGYVQGMSYLAATLCFHMDSFTAFKALVALMSSILLFDMFRLGARRTFHYIGVYNEILRYELPVLAAHFHEAGIDPQMYAVDWALTLFTRSLPLDLALRIWDVYVLLGTPFFFQASMGLLSLFQDSLLLMEAENIIRLLHNFPKTTSTQKVFEAIASVKLSCDEINELLAGGNLWSPDENRQVPIKFPDTYE
ncbi:hypothetical protein CCR75_007627 [Bremia lactucae]|uniref:Rab-GAP TBC domain-containing protein n=1 Tax=Bremia lactucae TaxID=4779 RepID=A0A976FFG9_BRELC|nr:hypothetical protein CCR75_007627 [Bremia lactucae]